MFSAVAIGMTLCTVSQQPFEWVVMNSPSITIVFEAHKQKHVFSDANSIFFMTLLHVVSLDSLDWLSSRFVWLGREIMQLLSTESG